jgi:Tfp pilus assembly protein PilO
MATRWIAPLIAFVFFAATIAVAASFIVPTAQAILRVSAETNAAHEQLERRYRSGLARGQAQRELAARERAISALRERIPADRDALAFVRSIEGIAAARGLEVRNAIDRTAVEAAMERRIAEMPMTIEFRGPFPALVAALRDTERRSLPIAPQSITVSGDTPTDGLRSAASRAQSVVQTRTLWRLQ